jgi:hypothetical protein
MDTNSLLAACLLIAALIGAGTGIANVLRWLWRLLRRVAQLTDDLMGEPARPGHPATPGALTRLAALDERVAAIAARTVAVAALQDKFAAVQDKLDVIEERFATFDDRLAAVEAQLRPNDGNDGLSLRDAVDRLAPPDGDGVRPPTGATGRAPGKRGRGPDPSPD